MLESLVNPCFDWDGRLKKEGLVWVLPAAEKDQEAVFSAEQPPMISVSEDIMQLWHQIDVCF